jgi:hypothetical protein
MGPCCPANIGLAYGSVAADLGARGLRVLRQFVEVATVIALDAINRGAIRRRGIRCISY